MPYSRLHSTLAFVIVGLVVPCDGVAAQTNARSVQQAPAVVAHSTDLSEREATLRFYLSDGESVAVSLSQGVVTLNEREIATYGSGGDRYLAWRRLLTRAPELGPNEMLRLVRDWSADNLSEDAYETLAAGLAPLKALSAAPAEPRAVERPPRPPRAPVMALDSGRSIDLSGLEALERLKALEGLEALGGIEALEDLAALEALEALKGLDVNALQREIREQLDAARAAAAESALAEVHVPETTDRIVHSLLSHMVSDIVGLFAAFVAMCSLGFGLVFFAPRQLEVVADTVRNSFWRSFFAGLFAQPLIIPIFGLLMLGLALTVVGILVIPFAAIAFAAAAVIGVLGGYLAVARSVGEAYLRRRMSQGHAVGAWLSYRYMVYGLIALFTIWLPAAMLGWAPVAGQIFTVSAILVSWIIATAGFGATILSHAGIRGTFTRRLDQSLSDEYLYRTPQATPVVSSRRTQNRDGS